MVSSINFKDRNMGPTDIIPISLFLAMNVC